MDSSMAVAPPPSRPTSSVKVLAESPDLKSIPIKYAYFTNGNNVSAATPSSDPQASIPVIDLSLLVSGSLHQRLKIIRDLGTACQDWGFFMVLNHGVPETLMKTMIEVSKGFFKLPEEDKMKLETKHVLDPIRCGTSFHAVKEEVFFWRDFLKVFVHPQFHSPDKPRNFSEVLLEYSKKIREIASKLLEGISESLGLEPEQGYMKRELQLESSLQIFTANYYPPCPQPEFAIGMPPHSDHGLLTILLQNEVGGLQIQHKGKWVNVDPLPNSFLVNTGDQLEVVNHGVPETLMKKMMEVTEEFFKLPEEEKMKLETKNILDPIQCGTSISAMKEEIYFWRDFLKVFVHPQFHSPIKPRNFSEVLMEYSKKTREIVSKLLEGISESLGLEPDDIKNETQFESSLQIFTVNYYPPCPQPELAIGLPPHSDHGLLTLLLPNEVGGLQIQHQGKWINVDPLPNSFLVNAGDQLEVFSNGRYKSLLHRATLSNEKTRISLVMTNGPAPEATVEPASKLVNIDDSDNNCSSPKYTAMKYMEYMELQQGNKLDGKSCL